MKKRLFALLLLTALILSSALMIVHADPMYSEDYYRAQDYTKKLSDTARNDLDAECINFIKKYKLDMVLLAIDPSDYSYPDLSDLAKDFYDAYGFGYGENKSGFLWIYDTNSEKTRLFAFGDAEGKVGQDYIDFMEKSAPELDGVYGKLYGGIKYLDYYFENGMNMSEADPDPTPVTTTGNGTLPSWFPADPNNFKFYHDSNAPRVVDNADIFTDAEERAMEERIREIGKEIEKDIVIYTDKTDYGFGQDVCAADFYDFNGYGYGDDYEGFCLFIDMDPNDRGWWACATGPVSRGLYTEDVANNIDDVLYEYMVNGGYAEGVSDWIEHIRTLYVKGTPFAPEWYPVNGETLTRHHDLSSPRVVDEAGLLTDAEITELSERAAEISEKYGVDVAIHTMLSPWGMDYTDLSEKYYTHMGYGYGDDYDGILLSVYKRPGYQASTNITAVGSVKDKLSDAEAERMRGFVNQKINDHKYCEGASEWLENTAHFLKTGRVPRSGLYWSFVALLGSVAGLAYGGAKLGTAKIKMKSPGRKIDANSYIVQNVSKIKDMGSIFLYNSVSRIYSPIRKESSTGGGGSSGGGRSSYRSSYSGHSGRSHTGSGRKF